MRRGFNLVISFALVVAACGDNDVLEEQTPDLVPEILPTAWFVGGDFDATGILSRVDVAELAVSTNVLAGVAGGEPWIRHIGDEVLIVNRSGGNNVTILGGSPLALIDQFSTGAGTNPQDVAVVGDKLYVPAYETAGVVVIDRRTRAIATLDLQAAAEDNDGMPDCSSAFAVGTRVFVSCQRQDRSAWSVRGPARMVVIDATNDTIETSFDIGSEQNPVGALQRTPAASAFGGDLLLPMVPSFTDASVGCLARIRTTGTPGFGGCAATNQALNGFVNRVDIAADGSAAWIAVYLYDQKFQGAGHLRALDLETGAIGEPATAATGGILDVAACPGGYSVATEPAGLRIWQDGEELTTAPLALGRDPAVTNSLICY